VTPQTPLDAARSAAMWLSESQIDLVSLHAVLPIMAADPDLSRSYYRFLRRIRETVHPRGVSAVRTVRFGSGEIEVDLGDELGCDLFYGLERSVVARDLFLSLLVPDDAVIDVGAGFGLYALPCGSIVGGGDGAVHAFESRPDQLGLLERNVQRLGVASAVQCHGVVLEAGDIEGRSAALLDDMVVEEGEEDRAAIGDIGSPTPDDLHPRHLGGLDGLLPAMGVHGLGALHMSSVCDVADVLAGGWQIVRVSPDPVILVEIDDDRLGQDGLTRLMEELSFLDDCGFIGFAVDNSGSVQSRWRVDGGLAGHAESVLFVRRAGHREETLRTLLPGSSSRGIRFPSIRERVVDSNGAAGPAHASIPLIAAMAVAKLRELDEITGQVGAHLTSPPSEKRSDEAGDSSPLTHEPVIRAEEILSLQAEVERLLKESDVRLQEARAFRQEAKMLRSRYEVVGGQRLRDLARTARRVADKLRGAPLD
jgi:hypothetical protein